MKRHLWLTMVACLAYCLDQELWKAIDYLKEQVRVLKEQQEKDRGSYTLWSNGLPIRGSLGGADGRSTPHPHFVSPQ